EFDDYYAGITRPTLKERNGQPVVYTDADGNQTPATALVGPEQVEEDRIEEGRRHRRSREVTLFTDDVASVSMKGTVTIDDQKWPVKRIIAETPAETLLEVVRGEMTEISRADYRRPA
ncbi:unnamed protein product, partial [marine sediment metagenome]